MTVSMGKKYVTRDGEHDAKVVYIGDKVGPYPVVVAFMDRDTGEFRSASVYTVFGGFVWDHTDHPRDLIEVPEDTQGKSI